MSVIAPLSETELKYTNAYDIGTPFIRKQVSTGMNYMTIYLVKDIIPMKLLANIFQTLLFLSCTQKGKRSI